MRNSVRQANQSLGRRLVLHRGSGDTGKSKRQLLVIKIHKMIYKFTLKGKQVLRIKSMNVNVERLASVVWKASSVRKEPENKCISGYFFAYSRPSASYNAFTAEPPPPSHLNNTVHAYGEQIEKFCLDIMRIASIMADEDIFSENIENIGI